MAQGAQEKVTPHFSERQKKIDRVNLLLEHHYEIEDYQPMADLLQSKKVDPIIDVGRLEPEYAYDKHYVVHTGEAREYFEYLQQIASGALSSSQETVAKAYDQLFTFMYAVRETLKIDDEQTLFSQVIFGEKEVIDIGKRVDAVSTQVQSLKSTLDKRHTEILGSLRLILELQKDVKHTLDSYKETLDQAKEYFDGLIRSRSG